MQRGEHDDRRPVLVVVEDRDVELLVQPALDLEAARRRDVLEVDAAEAGASAWTIATISSTSCVSRQIGKASTPPKSLNSTALPSITGSAASGPMSPRPSTAEPSVTMATVLPFVVSVQTCRVVARSPCRRARRRRVGPESRLASAPATFEPHLDLAADV